MTMALFMTVAHSAAPAWSVTLVRDGHAMCAIVVPLEDLALLNAARDLQYHLRTMSGSEVPIVHDSSRANLQKSVVIYIGTKNINVQVSGSLFDRSHAQGGCC